MPDKRVSTSPQQARNWPGTLARAANSIAKQQAEQDSRRRRLFMEASRTSAGIHVAKLVGGYLARLEFVSAESQPFQRYTAPEASKTTLASALPSDEIGRSENNGPQPALADLMSTARSIDAVVATSRTPDLQAVIRAHTGSASDQSPPKETPGMEPLVTPPRHFDRPRNQTERASGTDSISGLALKYSEALTSQDKTTLDAKASFGTKTPPETPLADTVALRHLHQQTEMLGPRHSLLANFGKVIGQSGGRDDPEHPHANFERENGRSALDVHESTAGTHRSARESIACVADELERLRAAVRRTIDDLERIRGWVQPSLPALPPNRGAFRIS